MPIAGKPGSVSRRLRRQRHCGETGYQKSHTSLGVDLEKIAADSGIKRTLTTTRRASLRLTPGS